jgi:hypothetical protein
MKNKFSELYNATGYLAGGRSDRVVQMKSSLSAIYSKEIKDVAIKFTNCDSLGYTYMSVYLDKCNMPQLK